MRFLLILVFVLHNAAALPALHGEADPLMDSHCIDPHELQTGGQPSCATDCQCPPGSGTMAVGGWVPLSTSNMPTALPLDTPSLMRRVNYDPPFRPPRKS